MSKKVMLLVPMLHQGGFERICALTAKLLKDRHEVYLVIFSDKDKIYDVTGVNVINLDLGAVDGRLGKVINLWKRVRRLKQLKRKLDVDVCYSFGVTANIANVLSKCQEKTWAGIRGYGVLAERRKMQLICKRADKVVSCTKVMEEDINRLFGTKSSAVLYNPCNTKEIRELSKEKPDFMQGLTQSGREADFGAGLEQPEKTGFREFLSRPGRLIASMGREDDLKCFWHLLKSFSLLKKKLPDCRLMIIGEGEYTEYKKLAEELGVAGDVLFTGVQKNPFALLKRADVYALTSESEGFPNALLEAMVCGLPAVSVNCKTGPAEILHEDYQECSRQDVVYVGDYGIITPIFKGEKNLNPAVLTKEEESFAQELYKMLTQEERFSYYKEKALERAEAFSMEAYTEAIERLLKEV